ncbi:hypothetical protein [Streptomyces sp. NRRL WC-3742]|uniref:hypothetical protein n=1 Tax=Streptomyces sp. NRRL WC-3742 TaxID=1463934 RepID=UPI0004C980A5|nr:hypothetical protein [Streptomyces sp. NRRL WC-3742]
MITATDPHTDPHTVPPAPRWAVWAAHAAALSTVPSGLWRIAMGFGLPVGYSEQVLRHTFRIPGVGSVAVIALSVVSEALALLTIGLVRPWGEVVPRWIPFIGGRRVRPLAAVVPAGLGALALTVLWGDGLDWWSTEHHPAYEGVWLHIIGVAYMPLVLWGPLLGAVTVSYYRRHRPRR